MTTVLIVERSPRTRRVLEATMCQEGFVVAAVATADEALRFFKRGVPDLVILDVRLPGMDGTDLCRRLKGDPRTAMIPVLLLLGEADKALRLRGLAAGADELIGLPVDRRELVVRVRALLRFHQLRRELAAAELALEVRRRAELRATFQRYIAPEIVERILDAPDGPAALARRQRCEAVILFADLRGFTAISERLAPDLVVELLNEFYGVLTGIAYRYAGTIFNMAGDCLLVGFNVPFAQADASLRAVRAAEAMLHRFAGVAEQWHASYGIEVGLGVGINRGEAVVGNVGSPTYMNYTLIGDEVNVASRLKDRARAGEILFTTPVWLGLAGSEFEARARPLPPITLKGKRRPVKIYSVTVMRRAYYRVA